MEKSPGCPNCETEGHGYYHASHGPRYPRKPIYRDHIEGFEVWIEDDGFKPNGSTVGTVERKMPDGSTKVEQLAPEAVKALRFLMDQLHEMQRLVALLSWR